MSAGDEAPVRRRRPVLALLPVVVFAALAVLFLTQLMSGRDPQALPSVLIGREAPPTSLPALDGLDRPGLNLPEGGTGRPVLVNVFASWCGPCRVEHPALMALGEDPRLDLVAINYKDRPEQALGFLNELGNPFAEVGVDGTGSATIDWGVYGVPETFLVSPDGTILWKHTGPLSDISIRDGLMPALDGALQPSS